MKNPFILWGSYVGLLIGLIGSYFSFGIIFLLAESGKFHPLHLSIMFLPLVLGFLAGWTIHSSITRK